MAAEPTIRRATPEDYGTFAALFEELGVDDSVASPERFRDGIMPTTLIAERGGRALGYAHYLPMKELVRLAHLVTAPDARRGGVGRALLAEVARHARAAGCARMALNVKPENAPAIRLYESFGLADLHRNHALRLDWSLVESRRAEALLAAHARDVSPGEDAALEAACGLPSGILAEQRRRSGRVIRAITHEPDRHAVAVFDVDFPGSYPFRAPDMRHAWSLLVALRPSARAAHTFLNMLIEDDAELASGLIAAGATLRLETLYMLGPLR